MCSDSGTTSYDELPLKIVCWGEQSGLLVHENAIREWQGWALYPNNDVVARSPVAEIETTSSSCVRLVPTFTGHIIERFGQENIHLFLLPFTQWLMSSTRINIT